MHTIQASVDAFDAINFVGDYEGQGTKVLYYTASNDQVIPVSQVPGRTLSAPAGTLGSYEINASVSYLSGAEPLLIEANAAAIENAGTPTVVRNVIRFKPGAGSHGGPCPATKDSDLTLDGPTIFGSWALSMIDNDAPAGTVDDGDFVLGIPLVAQTDWIDAAPIEDFFIDPLQCAPASS